MGGRDNEKKLNSVECYIPNKNEWIPIEPMNEIRLGAQAGVANGALFVFGGRDERVSATIERYDPEENKWTLVIFIFYLFFFLRSRKDNWSLKSMSDPLVVVIFFEI